MRKKIELKQEDYEIDFKKIKNITFVEVVDKTLMINFEMKN